MPQQQQTQPQPAPTPPKKKKIRVPKVVNGVEQMVEIEVDDVAGPTWGPNDKHTLLNHRLTRVDGPLKVSGAARYTYDVKLPGMMFARVRRCPHAHARLKNFDSSAASKIPGVKAIIQTPLKEFRFAGSPVAAVAAVMPTSLTATSMVTLHGLEADGVAGHVTVPDSAVPPKPGSGYVSTCGKQAETEQRSRLWTFPA